jgi:hypothetical protein
MRQYIGTMMHALCDNTRMQYVDRICGVYNLLILFSGLFFCAPRMDK